MENFEARNKQKNYFLSLLDMASRYFEGQIFHTKNRFYIFINKIIEASSLGFDTHHQILKDD